MKRIISLLVVVSLLTTAVGPAVASGTATPASTSAADSLETTHDLGNTVDSYVCGWTEYTGVVYCDYPWE